MSCRRFREAPSYATPADAATALQKTKAGADRRRQRSPWRGRSSYSAAGDTSLAGRLGDAARLAAVVVSGVLSRRPVRPRGDEDRRALPGDHVVAAPKLQWTHGITILARPADVWPWLVQKGCRRAGWYSYDGLDNGGVPSPDRIVPELQRVEVGEILPWTPKAEHGFIVRAVERERALVLGDAAGTFTWPLVLKPLDEILDAPPRPRQGGL